MIGTDWPHDITPHDLVRFCGVTDRTSRRWRQEGRLPVLCVAWLRLARDGDLGSFLPAWRAWHLRADVLISPEGWSFTPGDILAIPIRQQLVAQLRRELLEPRQVDWVAVVAQSVGPRRLAGEPVNTGMRPLNLTAKQPDL